MQAGRRKIASLSRVLRLLEKAVGNEKAVVRHVDPFRVLVSTVLSQRTRDENTKRVSRDLFKAYDTPSRLASAPIKKIEMLIRPSGFYHEKARHIKELSRLIAERFNGKTPEKLDDLLSLPGVGRKTANCVLVYGFNMPAIPVDTHVHRLSNRLGWAASKTPEETERQLMGILPKKYWIKLNNLMVKFGQKTCRPNNPKCGECPINAYCRYYRRNKRQMRLM
jgi:endonuclease-3